MEISEIYNVIALLEKYWNKWELEFWEIGDISLFSVLYKYFGNYGKCRKIWKMMFYENMLENVVYRIFETFWIIWNMKILEFENIWDLGIFM